MLKNPKIDKISFTINKRDVMENKINDILEYLDRREDIQFNKSRCYITVHITPTKLIRPNLNYNDSMKHNLQMNTNLLVEFFEQLKNEFSIFPHKLNVTELHNTKDRIMEQSPHSYNNPLVDNQTQYKGRVRAFEVNNGTTPTVHIQNESESMKRGTWFCKSYNKGEQLRDHLKVDEITPLEPLSKEDIKTLGCGYSKYTGRINLTKVNLMRIEHELKNDSLLLFPHTGSRLRVIDILTMIEEDTLTENLNRVFKAIMEKALFSNKKEPTKDSALDNFIVSGSMSEFDRLFSALGMYQAYKEYTNSVITQDDRLLNEIYDKFM